MVQLNQVNITFAAPCSTFKKRSSLKFPSCKTDKWLLDSEDRKGILLSPDHGKRNASTYCMSGFLNPMFRKQPPMVKAEIPLRFPLFSVC